MKRYAQFALLSLWAVGVATSVFAADATDADQRAIAQIEREWTDVFKTHDKSALEKHLTADFVYTDEEGNLTKGRDAYIAFVMQLPKYVDVTVTEEAIVVHGSTAVATGRFDGKTGGAPVVPTRYTDTFTKGPDGWKAMASQDTKTK